MWLKYPPPPLFPLPELTTCIPPPPRFLQRPEWLREGARLIIRDHSDGHIAGAGFVGPLHALGAARS